MHGRKRAEYKATQRDPKVTASLAKKAEQWHAVSKELAAKRGETESRETQLVLLDKLLSVNPDPLYLWNHRREIVRGSLHVDQELKVTSSALQCNPKAYGAWLHRKWTLSEAFSSLEQLPLEQLLQSELGLTDLFLQRDERNFHCWNYRRFIVGILLGSESGSWHLAAGDCGDFIGHQLSTINKSTFPNPISSSIADRILQNEWDFSTAKLHHNFSNFSAFFHRSQLFPWKAGRTNVRELITSELDMVVSALYTEPDDQSAWWYHHFLLKHGVLSPDDDEWFDETLATHLKDLEELSTEVPTCKWVFLGIYHVITRTSQNYDMLERKTLATLMNIDPTRTRRYQYLLSKQSEDKR